MNNQTIKQETRADGKAETRVTPTDIEGCIVAEHYINAGEAVTLHGFYPGKSDPLHGLIFCVLELRNGCIVTGESTFASSGNHDAVTGRKIARANAVRKIRPPVVSDAEIDDAAEHAYWQFDARRSGYAEWRGCPQSERDAFKAEARGLARGYFPVEKASVAG